MKKTRNVAVSYFVYMLPVSQFNQKLFPFGFNGKMCIAMCSMTAAVLNSVERASKRMSKIEREREGE